LRPLGASLAVRSLCWVAIAKGHYPRAGTFKRSIASRIVGLKVFPLPHQLLKVCVDPVRKHDSHGCEQIAAPTPGCGQPLGSEAERSAGIGSGRYGELNGTVEGRDPCLAAEDRVIKGDR